MGNPIRSSTYMSKKGSEKLAGKECSSAGAITGSLICFPIVQSWELKDSTPKESVKDEAGNQYWSDGDRTDSGKFVFLQRDPDTIQLGETFRGKYLTLVKEMTATALGGKYNYCVMPICQFDAEITYSGPAETTEIPFKVQKCDTAVGVDLTSFTGFSVALTCSLFTIAAGSYQGTYLS